MKKKSVTRSNYNKRYELSVESQKAHLGPLVIKLGTGVLLEKAMCRMQDQGHYLQGQGHHNSKVIRLTFSLLHFFS